MIRNTVLGLAAAAALALTASAASADGYGYYHNSYYSNSYYAPSYTPSYTYQPAYSCRTVIVGYRTVYTYYGYQQKPIYKQVCNNGY